MVYHTAIVVTTLWLVGWRTRLMTVLTYVFLWSLHERTPVMWDGGDNLIRLVLIYGCFANLGAYFSFDAERLRAGRARGGPLVQASAMLHSAAILAFALQLCLVYGVSGLYKVQGEMWQNGTALYYVMRVDEYTTRSVARLERLDWLGLLVLTSFREPGVLARSGVAIERAEARMQAIAGGTVVEGIHAISRIATRLPLLWPALPLLWLAARLGVGQQVYDWLATRRTIVPAGCDSACEIDESVGSLVQRRG